MPGAGRAAGPETAAILPPGGVNSTALSQHGDAYGTASEKKRRETLDKLQGVPADEPLLVIATGKYVGGRI